MEFTLNAPAVFPPGTNLSVYAASGWIGGQRPSPGSSPRGSVVASGIVGASGAVTFAGLTERVRYYAAGEVGGSYRYVALVPRPPGRQREVASANTLTLPAGGFVTITGTTEIQRITAAAVGTVAVLHFTGSCKVLDGENLKLAGNCEAVAEGTLTLACDGTNWFEISRTAGAAPSSTFNVMQAPYNAAGDGVANDRAAIQSAIAAATAAGGGTVLLPSGHTFLSGNLKLAANVTLEIPAGATLKQSQNPAHYSPEPHKGRTIPGSEVSFITYLDQNFPLVYAGEGVTNAKVTGAGTIQLTREGTDEASVLVHGIGAFRAPNFKVSGVTIKGASGYNTTLRGCENFEISGITTSEPATINSDGVSLMNCRHGKVHGCTLNTLDDGIYVWASFEDPRKSEWWNSDTAEQSTDIEIYENVVHNTGAASHGFFFINWTLAAADQSQCEISKINVHDNTFEAPIPLSCSVLDPYHVVSQRTPSKDLTFLRNTWKPTGAEPEAKELSKMATANLKSDNAALYNFAIATKTTGIYNSNFEGKNAFSHELGSSFWTLEGSAHSQLVVANHVGQIDHFDQGYAAITQGIFLEAGVHTFTGKVVSSGATCRMIARQQGGAVLASSAFNNTGALASKTIEFTVAVAGVYQLGIDNEGAGVEPTAFAQIDETSLT